jgi:predicted anti-sigma-YlaC factor YlaD
METTHRTSEEIPHSRADCARTRQTISLRLDGELSELGQQRLARHLSHCEACAQFAISLANLTKALRYPVSS